MFLVLREGLFPFKASESLVATAAAWICIFIVFIKFVNVFSYISSNIFPSRFQETPVTHVRPLEIVRQLTNNFFKFFFPRVYFG